MDLSKTVKVQKVKQLGIDLMVSFRRNFPFAIISPSVHQMAAHSWELFRMNYGLPISMWSESPIEAWNKFIRAFKSGPACRARQHSIQVNILDTFTRMLVSTHPKIAAQKRLLVCSICKETGHTARKCINNLQQVYTEEEQDIQDMFD